MIYDTQPLVTAPKDGRRILVGGRWKPYYQLTGGTWIWVTASWSSFSSDGDRSKDEWIGDGLAPLKGWNVEWLAWHPLPEEPKDI